MKTNQSGSCSGGEGLVSGPLMRVSVHIIADENRHQGRVAIKPIGPAEGDGGTGSICDHKI